MNSKKEPTKEFQDLRKAAEPLIKYLCENHNPHVTAIVTSTSVELLGGIMSIPEIYDHLID
jgi:ABC-type phosphate/phosphonate transport system substrate-binding protein